MSPAKHSYWSVTEGQTDDGQSDPYVSLCFAGDTKMKSGALLPSNLPRVIDRSNLSPSRLSDKYDRSMTLGITRQ